LRRNRSRGRHRIRSGRAAEDVRAALEETFSRPGSALVDLVTDPNALSLPPHISAGEVRALRWRREKVVVDGGIGRILEMARTNLRNIPRASTRSLTP
jgi:pyruvate dehydrogenase (quinone)